MNKKNGIKKEVMAHLKEDMKESRESIKEDKSLKTKIKKALAKSKAIKRK